MYSNLTPAKKCSGQEIQTDLSRYEIRVGDVFVQFQQELGFDNFLVILCQIFNNCLALGQSGLQREKSVSLSTNEEGKTVIVYYMCACVVEFIVS